MKKLLFVVVVMALTFTATVWAQDSVPPLDVNALAAGVITALTATVVVLATYGAKKLAAVVGKLPGFLVPLLSLGLASLGEYLANLAGAPRGLVGAAGVTLLSVAFHEFRKTLLGK